VELIRAHRGRYRGPQVRFAPRRPSVRLSLIQPKLSHVVVEARDARLSRLSRGDRRGVAVGVLQAFNDLTLKDASTYEHRRNATTNIGRHAMGCGVDSVRSESHARIHAERTPQRCATQRSKKDTESYAVLYVSNAHAHAHA
jgi:hypothetical protein